VLYFITSAGVPAIFLYAWRSLLHKAHLHVHALHAHSPGLSRHMEHLSLTHPTVLPNSASSRDTCTTCARARSSLGQCARYMARHSLVTRAIAGGFSTVFVDMDAAGAGVLVHATSSPFAPSHASQLHRHTLHLHSCAARLSWQLEHGPATQATWLP